MNPLALVSMPYRILAVVVLGLALVAFGWVKGAQHGEAKLQAAEARALKEGVRIVTLRGAVTTKIETKYLPQIARQQVITETILKEVPIYVPTSTADLPGGFRVLHDAAATGSIPDPARIADAAAVPAQGAAETIAGNYGACRADQIKLIGLQEWIREQAKVK